ncbi:MAG TPA: universal stress protein [Solirubrobacteraceae bacterium]
MFTTIVIGVDGRPGGQDAIALARRLASPSTDLIAVHVALDGNDVEAAERVLARTISAAPDLRGELFIADGVASGLHEVAASTKADLLVVGSSHRGPLGRLALGDDSRKVLRDARCAVAVAPAGYHARRGAITSIGVGCAGRLQDEGALALARTVAADEHAELRALHVVDVPAWVPVEVVAATDDRARALATSQAELDALEGVTGESRPGARVEELRKLADDVDLLVLGARHHSRVERLLVGSTVDALAAHASSPLLVAPANVRTTTIVGGG